MTPFLLALVFTTHFPSTTPAAMAVRANVVYAVANGTLYRSGDGGATFAAQSSGVGQIAVDPENAGIVYESLGTRVRRSFDERRHRRRLSLRQHLARHAPRTARDARAVHRLGTPARCAGSSWQTSDAVPFDDVDELFIANGAFYAIKAARC